MKLYIFALLAGALSVNSAFAYTFDDDVPQDTRDQITNDMKYMGSIQGDTSTKLHGEIFGKVDGAGYVKFFESRVAAVGLNDCGPKGNNAVACVIPMMDDTKIWLTPNYTKFSHPTVAKMMVVFHESRHTESNNGNWGHANCPTPFVDAQGNEIKSIWTGATLAGQPACDETPYGSYGSSTIMLKNIQKFCKNCTDKVKMDAGMYADDQLKRITNPDARKAMESDFAS